MSQKIIAKVSDGEVKKLKNELKLLQEVKPDLSISAIRFGTLGDDNVISFNTEDENYPLIVDKMIQLGINLLLPIVKQAGEKTTVVENNINNKEASPDNSQRKQNKDNPASVIDSAIKSGDYETLIKVSKDIRFGHEQMKKAKDNLYDTVISEIDRVYSLGQKSRIERVDCIERLIKIASDKDIKALHKIDALKAAGLAAVKLCTTSNDYMSYLIQLCNNNVVPNIINVNAAIALSGLVLPEPGQSNEDLDYAIKYLNYKWLLIAYDIVINELSLKEKDRFIQLINAIKDKR